MVPLLQDAIGYAAATMTTVAFVPQALHSWKTRDLSGVSLTMYGLFTLGVALWLLYGVLLDSWPIIVANVITLALASLVLGLKLTHKPDGHRTPPSTQGREEAG